MILITGAAGRIGRLLARELSSDAALLAHFPEGFRLRLTDILPPREGTAVAVDFHTGNLSDPKFVETLFADGRVQAVVHLAGYPREAEWAALLDANLHASINIWEAARSAGVDRVVYASSNHAIGLHPRSVVIDGRAPQRPDSRYGLIKCFCEDLGFLYAHKFGVRSMSLRIGMFLPEPTNHRSLSTWFSYGDAVNLFSVGLTADYVCETVYGVSANTRSFWDNSRAMALGYRPQDNSEAFAHLLNVPEPDAHPAAAFFQGGPYVAADLPTRHHLAALGLPDPGRPDH
ncbi:MAG TPA: NAD(P)-dependent oxidoreductase [Ramlibacter sp.]